MSNKLLITGIAWAAATIIGVVFGLLCTGHRGDRGLTRRPFMVFGFLALAGLNTMVAHGYANVITTYPTLDWFDVLALAAPFAILNVWITGKRLAALSAPNWSAAFALFPFTDLLLYLALCFPEGVSPTRIEDVLKVAQRDKIAAAVLSTMGTACLGLIACVLSITVFKTYGFVLFLFLPIALGTFSSLTYGWFTKRGFWQCQAVSIVSVLVTGLLLLAFAVEGIVCILMALPLTIGLSFIGAILGYFIQDNWTHSTRGMVFCLPIMLPAMFAIDAYTLPKPPVSVVSTSMVVRAPIGRVWQACISDSTVPRSRLLAFLGVNEPVRCTFDGRGQGSVRKCSYAFGTTILEPIEIWNEPHLLKFSVHAYPPVMKETSPYANLHPLHVDKHYIALAGQMELNEVADGTTTVTATTWYTHNVWPIEYWKLWSDFLMHEIHKETLEQISLVCRG